MFLVLIEAGLAILFPLFIGYAIDDAIKSNYQGAYLLAELGVASLIIGAGRRFYDSRFYAHIFEKLGVELSGQANLSASKKTARLNMMREILEFFENSVPELVGSLIGLVGVLLIIASLNIEIFYYALGVLTFVFLIYALTRKKTIFFNYSYNEEIEHQVDVITKNDIPALKSHLKNLMKWNIKLSDLEMINFSAVWLVMMAFLVYSIILAVGEGVAQYGVIFALVMYLFQYIENVIMLPVFYQQWLRLAEISERLRRI